MLRVFEAPVQGRTKPYSMRNCHHNAHIGIRNRMFREIKATERYDVNILDVVVRELADRFITANGGCRLNPKPFVEFYDTRVSHTKKRLGKAIETIAAKGFNAGKSSTVKMFIKNERYELKEEADLSAELKAPRAIYARSPEFGCLWGPFVVAMEELATSIKGMDKGKDYFEMGRFIEQHPQDDWLMYDDDGSAFEASISAEFQRQGLLKLMYLVFEEEHHDLITKLFNIMLFKSGYTSFNQSFTWYALICSGEFSTWLFNTMLNWEIHRYFEIYNNLPGPNFEVTGDDGRGAIPRDTPFVNTFQDFGIECKFHIIRDSHDLDFCSAKHLEYAPGKWMLCPNPRRILRNLGLVVNPDFYHCLGHYYYSIGEMYEIMFPGFPFFTQLGKFLKSITNNPKVKGMKMDLLQYHNPMLIDMIKRGKPLVDVNPSMVEIGFVMAFGLQRSELDSLYSWFDTTTIDITGRDKAFNRKGARAESYPCWFLESVHESALTGLNESYPAFQRKVRKHLRQCETDGGRRQVALKGEPTS